MPICALRLTILLLLPAVHMFVETCLYMLRLRHYFRITTLRVTTTSHLVSLLLYWYVIHLVTIVIAASLPCIIIIFRTEYPVLEIIVKSFLATQVKSSGPNNCPSEFILIKHLQGRSDLSVNPYQWRPDSLICLLETLRCEKLCLNRRYPTAVCCNANFLQFIC